jgi:hypothetical protein
LKKKRPKKQSNQKAPLYLSNLFHLNSGSFSRINLVVSVTPFLGTSKSLMGNEMGNLVKAHPSLAAKWHNQLIHTKPRRK